MSRSYDQAKTLTAYTIDKFREIPHPDTVSLNVQARCGGSLDGTIQITAFRETPEENELIFLDVGFSSTKEIDTAIERIKTELAKHGPESDLRRAEEEAAAAQARLEAVRSRINADN